MEWPNVFLISAIFVVMAINLHTEREEHQTELSVLRDSVTVLQDSLNATRAEPIYFNELKLIGFDCRLLLPEDRP